MRRHPHDPEQPNHTFYFSLEDGRVIDANVGGNAARWINHSCKPNCEADEIQVSGESRVFILLAASFCRAKSFSMTTL